MMIVNNALKLRVVYEFCIQILRYKKFSFENFYYCTMSKFDKSSNRKVIF